MKDCFETGAEYVAMIEDDTLAVAGWLPRLVDALDAVATNMRNRPRGEKWIYLRLFYTDDLLGWNSEDWPVYLSGSFIFWASVTAMMVALKKRFPRHLEPLTFGTMATVSSFCIPAVVLLYFMAGRQTVSPISPGIHEMNKYGCCSQGLVFPRSIIPPLVQQMDLETRGLVDMMIEKIADRSGYVRWAVVPPLLQHIGTTSSKGYGFDVSAQRLWNFRYELYPSLR